MKHACEKALDSLEPLIARIRALPGLDERKPGIFYRKSSALIHFHEDPTGFFADLKDGTEWVRFPVNNEREKAAFIREARKILNRRKS